MNDQRPEGPPNELDPFRISAKLLRYVAIYVGLVMLVVVSCAVTR